MIEAERIEQLEKETELLHQIKTWLWEMNAKTNSILRLYNRISDPVSKQKLDKLLEEREEIDEQINELERQLSGTYF